MNRKILAYEIRRLIFDKMYLGLLVITAVYAYLVLRGDIIQGVADTAPFSAWSYGGFLASILPMLLLSLLFFISSIFSKKEKRMAVIKSATPVDPLRYGLLRYTAIVIAYLGTCLLILLLSFVFYAVVFRFYAFENFLLPAVLTLLPALFFVSGLGLLAGRLHPALLYILMLLVLFFVRIPLPYALDLSGVHFFYQYPITLPVGQDGEPAFIIPTVVYLGKALYALLGMIFTGLGLMEFKKSNG